MLPVANPWLEQHHLEGQANLRIFTFPFAGGTSYAYRNWQRELPERFKLCPVQLPGRGRRLRDSPYTHMPDLIPELAGALLPYLNQPFAFLGHSMGGLITFELARHLQTEHQLSPLIVMISACTPAHLLAYQKKIYDLPDAELIEELRAFGGSPEEVLTSSEMMKILLPVMRSDLKLIQTYIHQPGPPLQCPIAAVAGRDDLGDTAERMARWSELTEAGFTLDVVPGGHFFIFESQRQFLDLLTNICDFRLGNLLQRPAGI